MRWQGYPYVYCLQNAVGALRMLAIENEINRDAIRLAGGVRALVRVLEGSCDHRDVLVRTRQTHPASLFHRLTHLPGYAYPVVLLSREALLTHKRCFPANRCSAWQPLGLLRSPTTTSTTRRPSSRTEETRCCSRCFRWHGTCVW